MSEEMTSHGQQTNIDQGGEGVGDFVSRVNYFGQDCSLEAINAWRLLHLSRQRVPNWNYTLSEGAPSHVANATLRR